MKHLNMQKIINYIQKLFLNHVMINYKKVNINLKANRVRANGYIKIDC